MGSVRALRRLLQADLQRCAIFFTNFTSLERNKEDDVLGAVVSSSEWSSEAMSMRQPALALQLRGQRAAAPEQGGELKRSLYPRLPSSPRAHLSLEAPCQHAVPATPMSLADQQAARTHLQVVAPAKSHEHTD